MQKSPDVFTKRAFLSRTGGLLLSRQSVLPHPQLHIINRTKKYIPQTLLRVIFRYASKKNTMEVSVVFLGDETMRKLNMRYRGKNKPANVLAFPLTAHTGEICVNPVAAKRETRSRHISYYKMITYLFLHGLLHLYGFSHTTPHSSRRMEQAETLLMNKV